MQPDRYEVSPAGRRRLSGFIQKRGSATGLSPIAAFLFGGMFVALGTWVMLVGLKVVSVTPRSVHSPYWVLTVVGACFDGGGLMIWVPAWKEFMVRRGRVEAARRHPGEPALADYPWHPDGFTVSEWMVAAKSLGAALGISVFLLIFNWWAFFAGGPWMVKGIVILFDIVAVFVWGNAARAFARAFKFGHSRVEFATFPCRLPGPVVLRWQSDGGISRVNSGTFTLRCVEEWMERTGSGRNQSIVVVHEEIWSATGIIEQPRNFPLREAVELSYELPPDALPTRLSADRPIFWELEAKLTLPGLNFKETYLVPVYGA